MNELKRIAEFQKVLADYQLAPSAKKILDQTNLALLVGPTSSGRNTIIDELIKTGDYHHIVSDTTRELRLKNGEPIERNGREYWFRTEEDVLDDLQKGEYMEAAIIHGQQVSGCNIRELEVALDTERIAIKDITETGAETIHALKPEAKIIFVTLPDFETWMNRLHHRSELPEDELRRRLSSACAEITTALENDYYKFVVNKDLHTAVAEVNAIAKLNQVDPRKQKLAREVAKELYKAAQDYLKQATPA